MRFEKGREEVIEDSRFGLRKLLITLKHIEKLRDFLKTQPKLCFLFVAMEAESSKDLMHCIMNDQLG